MKRKGNSRTMFIAGIGVVIVAGIFVIVLLNPNQADREVPTIQNDDFDTNEIIDEEPEEVAWIPYENEEYGFKIEHPEDWIIGEFPDDMISPKFNIYKKGTDTSGLPFTHHSEAVTHVSIFPEGIPTEGFFGESVETNVDFTVSVENARDFVLTDNIRFATIANMPEGSVKWMPSGFVFAHTRVENMEVTCLRGGESIAADICDPLMGDTVVRSGQINAEDRAIQQQILETLEFTD